MWKGNKIKFINFNNLINLILYFRFTIYVVQYITKWENMTKHYNIMTKPIIIIKSE